MNICNNCLLQLFEKLLRLLKYWGQTEEERSEGAEDETAAGARRATKRSFNPWRVDTMYV
jgi:hypothetical protein